MGVQLDWKVDDIEDSGNEQSSAGVPPPASRPTRMWLRLLILGLLLVVLAAGLVFACTWRAIVARDDEALRALVTLEARAYGENDEELFMAQQDAGDEDWRTQQQELMVRRARWTSEQAYTYTLEITRMHVDADRAWVEVTETRPALLSPLALDPGQAPARMTPVAYRRVAFYRRVVNGWRHTAPPHDSSYWGNTFTLEGKRYTFVYPQGEEAVVRRWSSVLEPAAERACADLGCQDSLHWTVTISRTARADSGDAIDLDSALMDATDLRLPSPSASGYPAGDALGGAAGFVLQTNMLFMAIGNSTGQSLMRMTEVRSSYWQVGPATLLWEWQALHASGEESLANVYWRAAHSQLVDAPLKLIFAQDAPPQQQPGYIPLAQLGDQSDDENSSPAGIAEAYALLEYVAETRGREELAYMLRTSRNCATAADLLRAALGVTDIDAFERGWVDYMRALFR